MWGQEYKNFGSKMKRVSSVYVAKFEDAVHVLHCFQKKTQRTAKGDLELLASGMRNF